MVISNSAFIRSQLVSAAPNATELAYYSHQRLHGRQAFAPVTTCGYFDGNPHNARTADPGYGCRVDTANGLWGFCPTSVMSASDCGMAGLCVDRHFCTDGRDRFSNRAYITTFS
jgi:hypothetical protein